MINFLTTAMKPSPWLGASTKVRASNGHNAWRSLSGSAIGGEAFLSFRAILERAELEAPPRRNADSGQLRSLSSAVLSTPKKRKLSPR